MNEQAEMIAQALDTIPEPTIRKTACAAFRLFADRAAQSEVNPALKSMEITIAAMQQAMRVAQTEASSFGRKLESIDRHMLVIEQALRGMPTLAPEPPPTTAPPKPKRSRKPKNPD